MRLVVFAAALFAVCGALASSTGYGCPVSVAGPLAKGDLVFVVGGDSDFSRAITSATAADSMAFDHVGIIDVDSAGVRVVESSPREGVTITPWSDFTASSPRLMVVRVSDSIDVDAAV